nr:unnamed protein product [Callosobruchus chinensis]
MMIASRSFITQEVHDQNIRLLFLTKLQNSFEDAKQLQKTNPVIFRNSVHLLGEFYNKARLANGLQLKFMATPLLTNLKMLLDTPQIEDLKLFTTQLYLNGASLKTECPDLLSDVLNSVRLTLVSDKVVSKECRLWLLLALDVASNRFGLQPAEIQKFYQEQLGDGAMADFQSTPAALSVQTPPDNKDLDGYRSSVNVLQISSPPPQPQEGATSPPPPPHQQHQQQVPTLAPELNNTSQSSGFVSDSSSSSNRTAPSTGSKCGRPILGIGARLKNKVNNTSASDPNWKEPGTPGGGAAAGETGAARRLAGRITRGPLRAGT